MEVMMTAIRLRDISWILLALTLAQAPGHAQTKNGPVEFGFAFGAIGPMGDFHNNVRSWSIKDKVGYNFDLTMDLRKSESLLISSAIPFGSTIDSHLAFVMQKTCMQRVVLPSYTRQFDAGASSLGQPIAHSLHRKQGQLGDIWHVDGVFIKNGRILDLLIS